MIWTNPWPKFLKFVLTHVTLLFILTSNHLKTTQQHAKNHPQHSSIALVSFAKKEKKKVSHYSARHLLLVYDHPMAEKYLFLPLCICLSFQRSQNHVSHGDFSTIINHWLSSANKQIQSAASFCLGVSARTFFFSLDKYSFWPMCVSLCSHLLLSLVLHNEKLFTVSCWRAAYCFIHQWK